MDLLNLETCPLVMVEEKTFVFSSLTHPLSPLCRKAIWPLREVPRFLPVVIIWQGLKAGADFIRKEKGPCRVDQAKRIHHPKRA